jgi:hypothetical protein
MDLNREPHQMASAAAEEIRALNHRTLDADKAFTYPGQVSDTANGIATLLERLPQALRQMEAGLEQLRDDNAIRLDDRPENETSQKDIHDQVFAVTQALSRTRELLGEAHTALRQATGPLSHMGGLWEDDEA